MPSSVAPPSTGQSLTVEYVVTGSLDGVTPAPRIEIDQSAEDPTPFDEENQIYTVEVENLGVIDPDLGIGGSIGPRCIPFFWVDTDELGDAGAVLEIVGLRAEGAASVQRLLEDLTGKSGTFFDAGFIVPQGSGVRVDGFVALGEPIRVRVSILVPTSCGEFSLNVIARKTGNGGNGTLCDTTPVGVMAGSAGSAGTEDEGSRCDHNHPVPVEAPVAIGTANAVGTSSKLPRADHVHAHGSLPGAALHATCTAVTAGFMSAAQCAKLNAIPAGVQSLVTIQAGRNGGTAAGNFYRLTNGMTMDASDRGAPVPLGTLILLEWTRTDSDDATLEVLVNGAVVATLASTTSGKVSSGAISIAVAAGLMAFRNLAGENTTSNVQITALIAKT